MALTKEQIQLHISTWSETLKRGSYAYRTHWPARLFRHEPVENVVKILKSGALLSRNAAGTQMARDIASKQVIATSVVPHRYARLYFRPLNPTQYHVEGIRKPHEFYQDDPDTHAPILVMMLFNSASILSLENVSFSPINMQALNPPIYSKYTEFQLMDFQRIYHDGPVQDKSIHQSRCAEALIPNQLPLSPHLQSIFCRSPAERQTLLYLSGHEGRAWASKIHVYEHPGIFQSIWSYVNAVSVNSDGVVVKCHPRRDGQSVRFDMEIKNLETGKSTFWFLDNSRLDTDIITETKLSEAPYLITVKLDNFVGYQAITLLSDLPF